MSIVDAIRYRVGAAFKRRRFDRDLEADLALYLELDAQERHRGGAPAAAAAAAARRDVGNVTVLREELRLMSVLRFVDATTQDLRYSTRTLVRSPVFTLIALATLAFGIGATTAIFSVMHALLFARLPVPRPEELVQIRLAGQRSMDQFPLADFQALRLGGVGSHGIELAARTQAVTHIKIAQTDDYV